MRGTDDGQKSSALSTLAIARALIPMRILITGITGFVGGHLVEHLAAAGGHALVGVSRRGVWPVPLAHLAPHAKLVAADLCDPAGTERVLRDARPEWVIHLAGYANTGGSFKEPDRAWAENLTATRSLYDAIARSGLRPRTLFVSTGLIYGEPDRPDEACDEYTTLKPASPYAASKAAADLVIEAREREAVAERARRQEAIRRDRNLLARFPDEAAHRKARAAALDDVRKALRLSEERVALLMAERKPLMDEAEFYVGKPLPGKLRTQLDANDASTEAQRTLGQNQQLEIVRVNKLYDAELERLKKLWAGAQPGSLGGPAGAVTAAGPASSPRK